jgi:hypothetical protein
MSWEEDMACYVPRPRTAYPQPGSSNTYIPHIAADEALQVSYARNANSFRVNRYVRSLEADKVIEVAIPIPPKTGGTDN